MAVVAPALLCKVSSAQLSLRRFRPFALSLSLSLLEDNSFYALSSSHAAGRSLRTDLRKSLSTARSSRSWCVSRTGSCPALPSPAQSCEELTPSILRRLTEDCSSVFGPHMGPPQLSVCSCSLKSDCVACDTSIANVLSAARRQCEL